MSTSPDPTPQRGGPSRRPAALGAVLVLLALAVPWAVGTLGSGAASQPATAVALPGDSGAYGAPDEEALAPFVVAPAVVMASAVPAPRPAAAPGVPLRLVVPSLRVDAPVVPITAPGGVLLPPGDPQTLGWWSDGAQPGAEVGGALITGHTVHTGGGSFDDLETLQENDVVRVRTRDGVLEYAVTAVTVYRKATLARDAARVFSQDVPGRLVLITCEDWNGSGYDSNAVVFADRA